MSPLPLSSPSTPSSNEGDQEGLIISTPSAPPSLPPFVLLRFLSLSQELAAPGEMRQAQTFDFHFKNVEKQYESYQGINVKLRFVLSSSTSTSFHFLSVVLIARCSGLIFVLSRYFIRVTVARRMAEVQKEKDIWVHSYRMPPDSNHPIKMEVGIEDCLHIEFEYNKSK